MKKQNFILGAAILMTANAVSKILGAVFKIPLTYILNEEGMAVYNTAFQIYIMFLSFIISGFPVSISKTVAESMSLGNPSRARRCTALITLLLSIAGAAGSVLLYVFAPYFAAALKEENAVYAIRTISPSIFFVALGTGYKSYFQGISNMVPAAVSQVIEAFVKLAVGYALAVYFVRFGMNATVSGAVFGVTAGEIIATFILIIGYAFSKKPKNTLPGVKRGSDGEIIKAVLSIALPLIFAAAASNAVALGETAVVRNRLLDSGIGAEEARFLFGSYTGYALTIFHLPSGILATLGVSILPVIAGAAALNDFKRAKKVTVSALNLTLLLSLPCAVVMYMLPEELLYTLFKNTSAAAMLKLIAPCIIPVCMTQTIISVLQSCGKISEPFIISLAVSGIRILMIWYLVPRLNIYGYAQSSVICSFLLMLLEYAVLRRYLGIRLHTAEFILKPFLSAGAMVFAVQGLKNAVISEFGSGIISVGVICAAALFVYCAVIFLTGAVKIKEIKRLF